MGYRSEVALALTDDAVRLLEAIAEENQEVKQLIDDAGANTISENEEDKGGILHWDYIKWYDSYQEIFIIEKLLQTIPDEDFMFIRLGEESDDNVQEGAYYESGLYIQRAISW